MKVWSRRATGCAHGADELSLFDLDADADAALNLVKVCVVGRVTVLVFDADKVAVRSLRSRPRDPARCRGTNRCSSRGGEVHAVVRNNPPEQRMHAPRVERGGNSVVATRHSKPAATHLATLFIVPIGTTIVLFVVEGLQSSSALSNILERVRLSPCWILTLDLDLFKDHAELVSLSRLGREVHSCPKNFDKDAYDGATQPELVHRVTEAASNDSPSGNKLHRPWELFTTRRECPVRLANRLRKRIVLVVISQTGEAIIRVAFILNSMIRTTAPEVDHFAKCLLETGAFLVCEPGVEEGWAKTTCVPKPCLEASNQPIAFDGFDSRLLGFRLLVRRFRLLFRFNRNRDLTSRLRFGVAHLRFIGRVPGLIAEVHDAERSHDAKRRQGDLSFRAIRADISPQNRNVHGWQRSREWVEIGIVAHPHAVISGYAGAQTQAASLSARDRLLSSIRSSLH